jgi:hypothetical protein
MIVSNQGSIADAIDLIKYGEMSLSMSAALSIDPSRRLFTKVNHNIFYRKIWEYLYVVKQCELWFAGRSPKKAYGFGCGLERLPLYIAQHVQSVVATDAPPEVAKACWKDSKQYLSSLKYYDGFSTEFLEETQRISVGYHDMNSIQQDIGLQDFIWSASSLEHLGTMAKAKQFVVESSQLLTPGGMAAHCTEYNLSSNIETRLKGDSVYFRRRDVNDLAEMLDDKGLCLSPVNFTNYHHPYNTYVDRPPYLSNPSHMRVSFDGYALTSFGFTVTWKQ